MNMEKMTEKTQEALVNAQNIALENGIQEIDVELLHAALISNEQKTICGILESMGVNVEQMQRKDGQIYQGTAQG